MKDIDSMISGDGKLLQCNEKQSTISQIHRLQQESGMINFTDSLIPQTAVDLNPKLKEAQAAKGY